MHGDVVYQRAPATEHGGVTITVCASSLQPSSSATPSLLTSKTRFVTLPHCCVQSAAGMAPCTPSCAQILMCNAEHV